MGRILLYGDSYRTPNLYYVTRFLAPDPMFYFAGEGEPVLAVSSMERSRAEKESRVQDVRSFDDLGYKDEYQRSGDTMSAIATAISNLIPDPIEEPIAVEPAFPALLADILRQRGMKIEPTPALLVNERRKKSDDEISSLADAQARAEQAVSEAISIIAEAEVSGDNLIFRGVPLTSERLRGHLDVSFARDGYVAESSIIASGPGSSDPHWIGSGLIKSHQPIILDIFPQNQATRYHGDVTRTVFKGEPPEELTVMYQAVLKAQGVALGMIRPGANGRDITEALHQSLAEDGFGEAGPKTARLTHGVGHGLGLEIHEEPRIGRVDYELHEGDVVTVEPGLYDPSIGGVRIEDVVVVTAEGIRNLNRLPKELTVL